MSAISILKWDPAPRVLAFRYPNCELNYKSQLIVTESQEAVWRRLDVFMNLVIKTLGSMATVISAIVMGMFFVPLILIAVGIGLASLLADCLHPKRNLQNCSALVARSQSVPQS